MNHRSRLWVTLILPLVALFLWESIATEESSFVRNKESPFGITQRSRMKRNRIRAGTVGIVGYCVGEKYQDLNRLATYNHRAYADRYGYDVFQGNEEDVPEQSFITPFAWLKALYMYRLLSSPPPSRQEQALSIEWFLWLDCDALVARFDKSVVEILDELHVQHHHHMVIAMDRSSPFNTGVIFMRNCQWSQDLWKRALQSASNDTVRHHKWWEQKALHDLYAQNLHNESHHIYVVKDRWKINAFGGYNRGHTEFTNESYIWHRVHCVKPECYNYSHAFFCSKTPKGTYPTELCRDVPPWTPPNGTKM